MIQDFNEKGYLGVEIGDFQQSVIQQYQKLFAFLGRLNSYSQTKKFSIQVNNQDMQAVLSVSLFVHILNGAQAVYILSTYGLVHEGRVVLRSILEGFFLLAKMVNDSSFATDFIKADEINRLKLMQAARKYTGPLFSRIRDFATDEVIRSLKRKLKTENTEPINLKNVADSVGLGAYYDSVYRLFCLDTHAAVRSLEQYVTTDAEGEIHSVEWGPRHEDVPSNLAAAIDILLRAWDAINYLCKLGIESDLRDFMRELETVQNEYAGALSLLQKASMRIEIIRKEELNEEQTAYLRQRVAADEHRFDKGPCHDLKMESLRPHLFIVLLKESNKPIGILYRGGPKGATTVAWWLDQKFRGYGFGSDMIDLFANILKEEGVTGIGQIVIDTYQGRYNGASENLARRLKAHFGIPLSNNRPG